MFAFISILQEINFYDLNDGVTLQKQIFKNLKNKKHLNITIYIIYKHLNTPLK